ncbi:hypothetical protein Tco_1317321 [Tanacetum coccineum]
MANTQTPLLQELLHVVDSYDIKDQLLVLFQREVAEDSQKMHDYCRLSSELREAVRMRDEYMNELYMLDNFEEVVESIEIMRRMQLYNIEKASRLCGRTLPVNTGYCNLEFLSGLGFGAFTNEAGNYVGRAYFQSGVEIINVLKAHVCTSWSSKIQQNALGVRFRSDFPIHFLYTLASIILSCEAGVSCANVESSIEVVNLRKNEVEV